MPLLTDAAPSSRSATPLPEAAAAAAGLGPPVNLLVALTRIGSLIQRNPGYFRKSMPALSEWRPRSIDIAPRYCQTSFCERSYQPLTFPMPEILVALTTGNTRMGAA